ncbi:MAG: NAD(P)-dependent glycerol-3-phosphate dehydrogenase [Acidobacteria bacterium]|nr:NAD(P)-dependent glycerol-3-phosphate dehydrogenase [Acidobacteriota bacterium]
MSRIALIGAGAWGTALALTFARSQKHGVALWVHREEHASAMLSARENTRYLPGVPLPPEISITASLQDAITQTDIVFLVTPSEHLPATVQKLAPFLTANQTIISATKGLQAETHLRMSQVIQHHTTAPIAVLSGPTFAQELAAGMPTACVIASEDAALTRHLQQTLSSSELRIYRSTDVTGVELGGALKNIIAIAAGMVVGLELGSNALAALITRGMAEITRLAVACGAEPQTLSGLAGMGDLILTCTGPLSRNRSVGLELGKGRKLPEILSAMNGKVAEGVRCTAAALALAADNNIEMPITAQIDAILHHGLSPRDAMRALMGRPGAAE